MITVLIVTNYNEKPNIGAWAVIKTEEERGVVYENPGDNFEELSGKI